LSSRCSPSTSDPSNPRTAPNPATGNLNAVVKRPEPVLAGVAPGRWCGRGAWPTAC
jgi:hypothetical protein